MNEISRQELEAWEKYIIGKPCAKHPNRLIRQGNYGLFCGAKTPLGTWCSGHWPTDEWLAEFRKGAV